MSLSVPELARIAGAAIAVPGAAAASAPPAAADASTFAAALESATAASTATTSSSATGGTTTSGSSSGDTASSGASGGVAAPGASASKPAATGQEPSRPTGEQLEAVADAPYAKIMSGTDAGLYLNEATGNPRQGEAFKLEQRNGLTLHVYGSGSDESVEVIQAAKTNTVATTTDTTS